jgi:hypothetical protein
MAITHAQSLVLNSSIIHLYASDKTSQNLEVTIGNSRNAYLGTFVYVLQALNGKSRGSKI